MRGVTGGFGDLEIGNHVTDGIRGIPFPSKVQKFARQNFMLFKDRRSVVCPVASHRSSSTFVDAHIIYLAEYTTISKSSHFSLALTYVIL